MKPVISVVAIFVCFVTICVGQKVPMDHNVYDGWQAIGKMGISGNGSFVFYAVNRQKGDGTLYLQDAKGDTVLQVPRGVDGCLSKDDRYFICKVVSPYKEKRKIDKKAGKGVSKMQKGSDDSLLVFDIRQNKALYFSGLKQFKMVGPEREFIAWLEDNGDSIVSKRTAVPMDSLPMGRRQNGTGEDAAQDRKKNYVLNLFRLGDTAALRFDHVSAFAADTFSHYLAYTTLRGPRLDSQALYCLDMQSGIRQMVFAGAKQVKKISMSESPNRPLLAFVASGVAPVDTLSRQNDIYLWRSGSKARKLVGYRDRAFAPNWEVSAYTDLSFSRSGKRLFFEVSPKKADKDTANMNVDLDIWNTKSDILFTERNLNAERFDKRGYLAVCFIEQQKIRQLEDSVFSEAIKTFKGDGEYFYLATDTSRRIDKQWLGYTRKDYYLVDMKTGLKSEVVPDFFGRIYPSFKGETALFYDRDKRRYLFFNAVNRKINVVSGIAVPLYDETYDRAEQPPNYGVLGWDTLANSVYVYDRYDIWRIAKGGLSATLACASGRKPKIRTRLYLEQSPKDVFYFNGRSKLNFNCYYEDTKNNNFVRFSLYKPGDVRSLTDLSDAMALHLKVAKHQPDKYIYTMESYRKSPQVFIHVGKGRQKLSAINRQQDDYYWGDAKLFEWVAPTGKLTQGIVYLPENLDTTRKYPMITYFYERRNETLYKYIPPKPTGSALNISFFVSRGYVVFVPDIWYTIGHPGQSAYDYVLSGIKSLEKKYSFIDSSKLGVQGQSWGGYQVAYLITRTNLFKAAWAGAPVVDMFSAYGGIRWKTGSSRAMQYEKGQSRIGVTPWENKGLYIENSPLFFIPKIETPVVIMSNDGDGAVPWYQGIEFFMALRRFGKQAWLLNYRGEAHNLVQRENQKDIQRKEAEYFDWQLKNAPRPRWTY